MILRPQEYFTIVRGLDDHTDAGTYYVQAVVRNARTDALIETVNLEDQGGRRFSKPWQVPADTSGEGFYIIVTSTVYSDSGYTTKSANYGEKFETYLVQDRMNPNLFGGGSDIDYKKIQKMIKEEIANLPAPVVNLQEQNLAPVVEAVSLSGEDVKKVLTSALDSIKDVKNDILSLPQPESFDYSPFETLKEEITGLLDLNASNTVDRITESEGKLMQAIQMMQATFSKLQESMTDYQTKKAKLDKFYDVLNNDEAAMQKEKTPPNRDFLKFL